MEKKLYSFNSSQDVINLQTKYTLFKRVANILFSIKFDEPLNKDVMLWTINEVLKRNDYLRIRFVKKGKETFEYFEDSKSISSIKSKVFTTQKQMQAFILSFRKKALNCFKGETFLPVFIKRPDGKDELMIKISHYVADTYGINILVNDIISVYNAKLKGTELPQAPGSFEEVLAKDNAYKDNEESLAKDRAFYKEYFEVKHPEHPMYCGIHGDMSDRWMKYKKKGLFHLPYLFVKCDTEGYRLNIPGAVTKGAKSWCEENKITMSSFFFYTTAIAASLINDKYPNQSPLMLLDCRGTLAERKTGGTKVQSICVYTNVDYQKSFNENINIAFAEQNQLYRHTKLSYLEVENMHHKVWNYSMLGQTINFCFSFIPIAASKGASVQIHSNGKGSLVCYMAMMYNPENDEISTVYDIQKKMVNANQLMDFHNLLVHVIEKVLQNPSEKLSEIL